MSSNPFDAYKEFDVEIIEQNEKLMGLAFSEGALSLKFKLLITMAIDVENGALEGAIALGKRAQKMGATNEEIMETLRIAYLIGGIRALFTSGQLIKTLY